MGLSAGSEGNFLNSQRNILSFNWRENTFLYVDVSRVQKENQAYQTTHDFLHILTHLLQVVFYIFHKLYADPF